MSGLWGQIQEPGRPQDCLSGSFLHLLVYSWFFSAPQSTWWENGSPRVPLLQTEPHAKMDLTLFHPSCERRKPVRSGLSHTSTVSGPFTSGPGHRVGIAEQGAASREAGSWWPPMGKTPQKGSALSSCLWAQELEGLRQCDPKTQSGESFEGNTGEWSSKSRPICL